MILLCGICSSTVWKQISAVLLPEPQNFIMHQGFFLLLCYLSGEFFSSEKHSAILLLCSHLNSSRKPSPESWEPFSCQHINYTVYLPKVQHCLLNWIHSLVCFDIMHWFSGKHSRKLALRDFDVLACFAGIPLSSFDCMPIYQDMPFSIKPFPGQPKICQTCQEAGTSYRIQHTSCLFQPPPPTCPCKTIIIIKKLIKL